MTDLPPQLASLSLVNLALSLDDRGIATLSLNRPQKRNALDAATVGELIRAFTAFPEAGVRAVILRIRRLG